MNSAEREAQVQRLVDKYTNLYGASMREWLAYHQRQIVFDQCTYMGIPTMKNPMDAWMYQEILYRVRPQVVVEIGSASGGSTLLLADILKNLGDGVVLSVDKDRSDFRARAKNIVEITGDSSSQEIVDAVDAHCGQKRTLIIHDGDHSFKAVRRELDLYSPMVSVGSYFIVEDGIVDLFSPEEMNFVGRGPLHAIVDFLDSNRHFIVEDPLERYQITYNPQGYLRRVK